MKQEVIREGARRQGELKRVRCSARCVGPLACS